MSIWYHFPWARGNALVRIWPGDSFAHWSPCTLLTPCALTFTRNHIIVMLWTGPSSSYFSLAFSINSSCNQRLTVQFDHLQLKYLNLGKDYISSSTCLIVGLRKKIFTILFNKIIFSSGRGKTASWRGISSWDDGSTSPLQSPSPSSSWTVTGEILRGNVKGYEGEIWRDIKGECEGISREIYRDIKGNMKKYWGEMWRDIKGKLRWR